MKLDSSLFKDLAIKFIVGEIVLFVFLFFSVGYMINKDDPFFMESQFRFLFHLLPIIAITLFYGMIAGLGYYILFSSFTFLLYSDNIDIYYLLSLLMILLLLSEFWFYWNKRIKTAEEKLSYADNKLRDISRNLFLTKLSHDQLEKFYITKPVSLRKLILDIKTEIIHKDDITADDIVRNTFKLVVVNFNIQSGAVFEIVKGMKVKLISSVGNLTSVDMNDNLVKFSIEREQIAYITRLSDSYQTKYLAVIPIMQEKKIKYIVVLQNIPFINLNLDNLLSINLIFDYVTYDINALEEIKPVYRKFREFGEEFIKEVFRMYTLYTKFRIESTIVYIYINSMEETIFDVITTNIRGLDIYTKIYFKTQKFQIIPILLPFTDIYGANIFINRIKSKLVEFFSQVFVEKNVRFKYFKIEHPKRVLLEMYNFDGF